MASRLMQAGALAHEKRPLIMNIEGANVYVKENPGFIRFFLKDLVKLRQREHWKQSKLKIACAHNIYCFVGCAIIHADPLIVAKHVSTRDFDLLASHFQQVFAKLVESSPETSNAVAQHDSLLLNATANACLVPGFFECMARHDAFTPLAKFCKIHLKEPDVGFDLLQVVHFSMHSQKLCGNHTDGIYKVLSHLESHGVLAEAFRAMILPTRDERTSLLICADMEREPRFIRKKLCPGTDTGNVLKEICQANTRTLETSKSEIHSIEQDQVLNALKRLNRAAVITADSAKNAHSRGGRCSYCMELSDNLKYCGGCHAAAYCSKECQSSAWFGGHKVQCKTKYSKMMKRNDSTKNSIILAFRNDNYLEIMEEAARVTREHDVNIEDLVLILDFMPTDVSPAPAANGQFKIDTIERLTTEDCPAKPEWTSVPLNTMLRDVRKLYEKRVGSMLGIVRQSDGSGSIFSLNNPADPRWSNEALACFPLDGEESIRRLQKIGKWKDPFELQFLSLRQLLRKAHDKAGLDRNCSNDFVDSILKERKKSIEGDEK